MGSENTRGVIGAVVGGIVGLFLVNWSMGATGAGHGTAALIPFALSPLFLPWPAGYLAFGYWSFLGYLSALKPSRKRSGIIAVMVAVHAVGAIVIGLSIGSDYGSVIYAFTEHSGLTVPFFLVYCAAMCWLIWITIRGFMTDPSDLEYATEEEPPYLQWAKRDPFPNGDPEESTGRDEDA